MKKKKVNREKLEKLFDGIIRADSQRVNADFNMLHEILKYADFSDFDEVIDTMYTDGGFEKPDFDAKKYMDELHIVHSEKNGYMIVDIEGNMIPVDETICEIVDNGVVDFAYFYVR